MKDDMAKQDAESVLEAVEAAREAAEDGDDAAIDALQEAIDGLEDRRPKTQRGLERTIGLLEKGDVDGALDEIDALATAMTLVVAVGALGTE